MTYILKRSVTGCRNGSKLSTVNTFPDMETLNGFMLSDIDKLTMDLWRSIGLCVHTDGEYIDSKRKPLLCKVVYTINPAVMFYKPVSVTYSVIESKRGIA